MKSPANNKNQRLNDSTAGPCLPPASGGLSGKIVCGRSLHFHDFFSLRALRSLAYFELHGVSFVKGFVTVAIDCGVVDEHVRATVLADEPVPLGVIEPFHFSCSSRHRPFSFLLRSR